MAEIESTIQNLIKRLLMDDSLVITPGTNLVNDLGMDSSMLMMLVVQLEEHFNIIIPDDFFNYEKLSSFSAILSLVEKLSQKQP